MKTKFFYDKENKRCEFVIPLEPVTKKNSSQIKYRRTKTGKTVPYIVPSQAFLDYESSAIWFLKDIGIDYPVNIEAHYYMSTMKLVDLTNLNSSLHDVLVSAGTIKNDDAKIAAATDGSRVHYDKENPRTEVIITPTELTFKK